MKCPYCNVGWLTYGEHDIAVDHRGKTTKVRSVCGMHCDTCSEVLLGFRESLRILGEVADTAGGI